MSTALENITEKTNTSVENNPIRTEKSVDIGKIREVLKERFKDGASGAKALDGEYILASIISTQKDSAISYILNSAKDKMNELDLCSDDESTIKTYDKFTNILFSDEP